MAYQSKVDCASGRFAGLKALVCCQDPVHDTIGSGHFIDLADAVEHTPLPIVWCHSSRTLDFKMDPALAEHPNIIHIDDPTPRRMRDLYERCVAYLAFSRSESFGWAAVDALRYSRAVVTRPVGAFSFPESHQAGVHLVPERWEFDWSLVEHPPPDPPDRDLGWLSADEFRRRISFSAVA